MPHRTSVNSFDDNVNHRSKMANHYAGRGYEASTRLNLQHYLWKDTLGFLLHPDIKIPTDTPLKIADIGTGTGIWLFDLKRQLPPDSELHGFDMSDAQFPPSQWVPENVTLHTLNPFAELPDEYVEQYDVVHLRLFISVAEDNDLAYLIWNVARMLKPGGYLQWDEHNPASMAVTKALPNLWSVGTEQIVKAMKSSIPTSWVATRPDLLADAGFESCLVRQYTIPEHHLRAFADTQFMVNEELSYGVMDEETGQEYRELIGQSWAESQNGVVIQHWPTVTIGRIPS